MERKSSAVARIRTVTPVDVAVIGGGPSGMMAAGRAAACGHTVVLIEKNPSLGKKLLITGGGRCNVTNNKLDVRTMLSRYRGSGKFLFSTFAQFSVSDTITFFTKRGVPLKEENEGRLFPASNTARSVYDALVAYLKEGGVKIMTRNAVTGITKGKEGIEITLESGARILARSCIIAMGGTSRPETGSTGEGFKFLARLGHTVAKNDFALVPLALNDTWTKTLGGVVLTDVGLTVLADGKKQSSRTGKLLFTHVGISGPTILNMSKEIGELLGHSEVVILADLFPGVDQGDLRKKVQMLLQENSNKKLKNVLGALMPASFATPFLIRSGIDGETFCHSVRTEDRATLVKALKVIPLSIKGLLGADKAVISSGGVALEEVNFKTMESRVVPDLYIVGDLLNIDRPSGGYSLQLCWSTAFVAGSHAGE